jgi:hypothetical protein
MALEQSCFNVWLVMPDAQWLSVWIGVSACGWPISTRAVHSGMPLRVLWNRADSSTYVVDAMMFIMMLCMVPLCVGGLDVGEGREWRTCCWEGR